MRCAGTLNQYTRPHRQVTGTRMSARAETGPHCRCVRLTCPVLSSRRILCMDPHLGGVTMRRYPFLALAIALALVACSEADPIQPPEEEPAPEPRPATIDMMRVVKISGDQAAQVPPAGVAADLVAASTMPAWTSEPLVARVRIVQPQASSAADSMYVPAGTLVHWRVQDGCGELFSQTTATDDSAYTYNRWAPGTKAGTCTVQAGRLVNGNIVIDTTWTMKVLPGPSVALVADHEKIPMQLGDTVA